MVVGYYPKTPFWDSEAAPAEYTFYGGFPLEFYIVINTKRHKF